MVSQMKSMDRSRNCALMAPRRRDVRICSTARSTRLKSNFDKRSNINVTYIKHQKKYKQKIQKFHKISSQNYLWHVETESLAKKKNILKKKNWWQQNIELFTKTSSSLVWLAVSAKQLCKKNCLHGGARDHVTVQRRKSSSTLRADARALISTAWRASAKVRGSQSFAISDYFCQDKSF